MVTSRRVYARRKPNQSRTREGINREKGYYLVEALVCVLIIGIISAGLADGYAKVKSFGTHSQTELQAIALGGEIIDQLRSQGFVNLIQNGLGTHQVPIVGAAATGDPIFPRPLQRDTQTLTFYKNAANGADDTQNYLRVQNNQAIVNLVQGPNNQSVLVTVTINWTDGNGPHTYSINTTIASNGLGG